MYLWLAGLAALTAGCGQGAPAPQAKAPDVPPESSRPLRVVSESPAPAPPALRIPEKIYRAMIDQSRRESPLECCGVLGGSDSQVHSIHPLRNVAASQTRYAADERQLVEAHRWLRERQWQIVAIYHSHPRWGAVPSKTDLEQNYWGETPRIIISLLREPAEVRVWRLAADSYHELPWTLAEVPDGSADSLQLAPEAD